MLRFSWLLFWSGLVLVSARTRGKPTPSAAVRSAQEQLEAAAKEDEAANEKAGCFCQRNLAEKQQTVENMQEQLTQLHHDIDESKARISQWDVEVKMHSEELESNTKALSTAEAIRQKDYDRFTDEQQSHSDSIDQLQSALDALNKHGSVDAALIAVKRVTHRVAGQKGSVVQFQQHLRGKSSPEEVSGVLKHMVTTFSSELRDLREDEEQAKTRHEAIVSAKTQEIQSQKKHMLGKQQRLAKTKVTVGFNEDIKSRSEKLLDANVKLLNNLKQLCQRSDESFAARREAVQAETEALASAQAELAGASLLSVDQRVRGDGAEKICSVAIEIQEKSWKARAESACQQAKQSDTSSKQAAAEAVEELQTDIREAQDEAARKQDDCQHDIQEAKESAQVASKEESAEANFVGSEQQSAQDQIQDLTSQGQNADKAKADYEEVSMAQQKAAQALRVATTRGKENLEYAAGRAEPSAASKINEAIGESEKLMKEADAFVNEVQSKKPELNALWDDVRVQAGKVMVPLNLMKADSEESVIAIKEEHESRAHARAPQCDVVKLMGEVARLKNYRSLLGRAAESLAWDTLR
jgi:hypothetical protein